jgi:hypothetical protein
LSERKCGSRQSPGGAIRAVLSPGDVDAAALTKDVEKRSPTHVYWLRVLRVLYPLPPTPFLLRWGNYGRIWIIRCAAIGL